MKYFGTLIKKEHKDGIHYCMFYKGAYYDFSENFNCQLMDRILFNIGTDDVDRFRQVGRLKSKKDEFGKYAHFINKKNINKVFESFMGKKVLVEMKNAEENCF